MGEVRAFRIGWPLASGEFAEHDGDLYIFNNGNSIDQLPIEFFSHQLMSIDASSNADLLAFATKYGIPRHASRYGLGFCAESPVTHEAIAIAKEKSDAASLKLIDFEKHCWVFVSLDEARFAIEALQKSVSSLFRCVMGDVDSWGDYGTINAGSSNVFDVHDGLCTFPDNNLTNAICNQIIETIVDESPWKLCECEGCERFFKRHQPRDGVSTKTGKNPSRSKYCCIACQNRQGQRNRRESAENRILH